MKNYTRINTGVDQFNIKSPRVNSTAEDKNITTSVQGALFARAFTIVLNNVRAQSKNRKENRRKIP